MRPTCKKIEKKLARIGFAPGSHWGTPIPQTPFASSIVAVLKIFPSGIFSVRCRWEILRSQQVFTWCSKACRSRFTISLLWFGNLPIDSSGWRRWWSRSARTTLRRCSPSPRIVPLLTSASSIVADQRPRSITDALTPGAWLVMVIVVISNAANRQFVLLPRMLALHVFKLPDTSTDASCVYCWTLSLSKV